MRANLPNPQLFIGKAIPTRPDIQIIELIASGNDGHLFRAHATSLRRDFACKIVPRSNLQHSADGSEVWKAEIYKANMLRSPLVVKVEDVLNWKENLDSGGSKTIVDCIVLISELIEGSNLKDFMKNQAKLITISFVTDWLESMLNLFNEMALKSVAHGDLHPGNILVEDRTSFDLVGPRFVFRVTDFGAADATSEPRFKDDYLQLADMLSQFLKLIDFQKCSSKEKYTYNVLRNDYLSRHLTETDPTRDSLARRPRELVLNLRAINSNFERIAAQESTRLITPFDFLSCEQIGEASVLLHALYSDRFLGLREIESQNNVVVTGPRGCGKSTVFRSLSLDQRMRVKDAQPVNVKYIGVYYRCDDLYFAFPRYNVPSREEAWDIPTHFVTSTLLSRLLDSLELWASEYFIDEFNHLEAVVANALWDVLEVDRPGVPNSDSLGAIISILNKQRMKASERQRFANDPKREIGRCFGPEVLFKTCQVLASNFSFLRGRPIYFFVDDYSLPKVTRDLQANLGNYIPSYPKPTQREMCITA